MINLFNLFGKKFKIFVLGCQRSGTTMLRLILDSHPKIYCYGEINGYSYFEKNFRIKHNKKYNAFQLPIWTELFTEYESIRNYINDEDKILFIFRDAKQTISSMKSLRCYRKDCWFGINDLMLDKNYINYEVIPNINIWMNDKSRSFNKNFGREIKKYEKTEWDALTKAICYWKYKNSAYFKMKKMGLKVLPINYDMVVKNPKEELHKIMNFLEIKYDDNLLSHHIKKHDETLNNNMAMGNTRINRKIDEESLEKWKSNMNEEEIEFIELNSRIMMNKLMKEI